MSIERQLGPPYARPPIVEAVIEIRATMPGEVPLATLADMPEALREVYPTRRDRYQVEGRIESHGGQGVAATARQQQIGYQHLSVDEKHVVQFSQELFSFSRLPPYLGWEAFRDEARRLWDVYQQLTRPTNITRIGVRYINRLDLPLPFGDFRDYLLTVPDVAPKLPQALSGYFMRLEIPHDEGVVLIMQQALAEPAIPNTVALFLDLDAVWQGSSGATTEEALWQRIEALRQVKNNAFEACITDRLREGIA